MEGSLQDFNLADIIQLIDLGRKTGVVELLQKQPGQNDQIGYIYFKNGKIITAQQDGVRSEDALFGFFTWMQGTFRFVIQDALPPQDINMSNEGIIMEGIRRVDEWTKIKENIPSMQMVPVIAEKQPDYPIRLTEADWRILPLINGRDDVATIARASGFSEFRTCELIANLMSNGLVLKREAPVGENVYAMIVKIASETVAAAARRLVDDAYKAAKLSRQETTAQTAIEILPYLDKSARFLVGPGRTQKMIEAIRQALRQLP